MAAAQSRFFCAQFPVIKKVPWTPAFSSDRDQVLKAFRFCAGIECERDFRFAARATNDFTQRVRILQIMRSRFAIGLLMTRLQKRATADNHQKHHQIALKVDFQNRPIHPKDNILNGTSAIIVTCFFRAIFARLNPDLTSYALDEVSGNSGYLFHRLA